MRRSVSASWFLVLLRHSAFHPASLSVQQTDVKKQVRRKMKASAPANVKKEFDDAYRRDCPGLDTAFRTPQIGPSSITAMPAELQLGGFVSYPRQSDLAAAVARLFNERNGTTFKARGVVSWLYKYTADELHPSSIEISTTAAEARHV